jgi:hypothetical protein
VVDGGTGTGGVVTGVGGTGVKGIANGGTNRGVNVQTAAGSEESTGAAGLGLLGLMTAGLGVAAATVRLRGKEQRKH